MSEMIERVSEAICKACEHRTWDPEAMARAAINAMREPTEAMWIAGAYHCPHQPVADAYTAMIDAALQSHSSSTSDGKS